MVLERVGRLAADLGFAVDAHEPPAEGAVGRIAVLGTELVNAHATPPIIRMARATTRGARSIL